MTHPSGCALTGRDEQVRAYLTDRLPGPDRDEFESHMVGCVRCQDELRLGIAVRDGLRPRTSGGRSIRRGPFLAAALAVAAGMTFWLAWPRLAPDPASAALGAVVVAPTYLGVAVRGDGAPDSLFDAAMRLYDAGRWADAERGLRAAAAAGAPADAAWFFAGASALMDDRAAAADSAFSRVVAIGDGPYLGEAYFYRAKARLRLHRADDARADLRQVAAPPSLRSYATALADSIGMPGVR